MTPRTKDRFGCPACIVLAAGLLCHIPATVSAQAGPAAGPVLEAMAELSAATAPGGGGPDAYAALLADEYRRWTAGDTAMADRASWVDGVREWWDDGWRVADREARVLEVVVRGDHALVHRVVREEYVGPDGERTGLGAPVALSEVWERRGDRWLLFRVTAFPLDD